MTESAKSQILVVDDEPDLCWILGHILRGQGHEVVTLQSGAQALELLQDKRFPLIFLDAKLVDMDGLEVARSVRAFQADARIVLVSGYYYADDPAIRQALKAGIIDGFIAKPFSHQDILQVISR